MNAQIPVIDRPIGRTVSIPKHFSEHGRNVNIRELLANSGGLSKGSKIGRRKFTPPQEQRRIGLSSFEPAVEDLLIGMPW